MENHAIATMMTYFGSIDHGLGTEVDRGRGAVTSSKNRLESPLIYIYILFCSVKLDSGIIQSGQKNHSTMNINIFLGKFSI